jgi:hypothetical protein
MKKYYHGLMVHVNIVYNIVLLPVFTFLDNDLLLDVYIGVLDLIKFIVDSDIVDTVSFIKLLEPIFNKSFIIFLISFANDEFIILIANINIIKYIKDLPMFQIISHRLSENVNAININNITDLSILLLININSEKN